MDLQRTLDASANRSDQALTAMYEGLVREGHVPRRLVDRWERNERLVKFGYKPGQGV